MPLTMSMISDAPQPRRRRSSDIPGQDSHRPSRELADVSERSRKMLPSLSSSKSLLSGVETGEAIFIMRAPLGLEPANVAITLLPHIQAPRRMEALGGIEVHAC